MPTFSDVIEQPNKYKLQVFYTQIDRDEENKPSFKTYKFHANKNYFYPASTVKLPIGITAMIKLEELKKPGLNKETAMLTDSAFYCQKRVRYDSSAASGRPSIGHYIKKMYLVSDNAACARTYEFIGCDYLHNKLEKLGYKNVRVPNRLDGQCPGDTSKITPPISFINPAHDTIYSQGLCQSGYYRPHPITKSEVGKGYKADGKRIMQPKDFSRHNYYPLVDLHDLMRRLVFNPYLPEKEKLPLSDSSRNFLLKELGMYPRESVHPKYNPKIFYDTYKKYFIYGSAVATVKSDSIRIFNIVGRAYGFLIDCAYIVDFNSRTEFLLTAVIYTNEQGIVGSGRYEYDQIGLPFLKELSNTIYRYERSRKRANLPVLDEFNFFR